MPDPSIIWFRRDLRLTDAPTLLAAAAADAPAVAVFVLDDRLLAGASAARRTFLFRCLRALNTGLDGKLLVARGNPAAIIPALARHFAAPAVYVSGEYSPYGARRDDAVAAALGQHTGLVSCGSPYAVTPGRVRKADGTPYRVFTPFRRAWLDHGWRAPARTGPGTVTWASPGAAPGRVDVPADEECGIALPAAGDAAAQQRWDDFRAERLPAYAAGRDRPDLNSTSQLSVYLKYGCIHPRTLLRDLTGDSPAVVAYRSELAWREFYADVLHHHPDTARRNVNRGFDKLSYDSGPAADAAFAAWCAGQTGYPIVDAGMRQLRQEGWMHGRVRMITASFLTKDLHLPWWQGARYFMSQLLDGDVAANQHNWQWVAGTGTDAAPYFRVFNPTLQGKKFDPHGDYVRRWVPELRAVAGSAVHTLPDGPPAGYPRPLVDHAHERRVALARLGALSSRA